MQLVARLVQSSFSSALCTCPSLLLPLLPPLSLLPRPFLLLTYSSPFSLSYIFPCLVLSLTLTSPYMHTYQNRFLFFLCHFYYHFLLQLIEIQRSQFQSQEDLRQQIKVASFIAGLQGKPVVLFVPEGVCDCSMQDICSLMSEGKYRLFYRCISFDSVRC